MPDEANKDPRFTMIDMPYTPEKFGETKAEFTHRYGHELCVPDAEAGVDMLVNTIVDLICRGKITFEDLHPEYTG
jgi:hypothetical protein